MERHYHLEGKERRPLVSALEKLTGEKAKYEGIPTYAYTIGSFTVDRFGTLLSDDEERMEKIAEALAFEGFQAEEDADLFTISLPREGFSESAIYRITMVVASKKSVIQHALDISATPIKITKEKIHFPWFDRIPSADEVKAYTTFIALLAKHAKEAKRITGKDHEVENEKYYFRCFLLRIGMIGAEYKETRKVLLKNLQGSSSLKFREPDEEAKNA